MGEAVDTIPSILNKCLFVSPDGRTNEETDVLMEKLTVVEQNSPRCDAAFCLCSIKITPGLYGLK